MLVASIPLHPPLAAAFFLDFAVHAASAIKLKVFWLWLPALLNAIREFEAGLMLRGLFCGNVVFF
jgi:hypothetical protein